MPVAQLQDAMVISPELKLPLIEYAKEMNKHQINHASQQALDMLLGSLSGHRTSTDVEMTSDFDVKHESMDDSESAPGVD